MGCRHYKERDSQIVQSLIGQLTIKGNWPFLVSWTHYQILMRIENDDERTFYEQGENPVERVGPYGVQLWDFKACHKL